MADAMNFSGQMVLALSSDFVAFTGNFISNLSGAMGHFVTACVTLYVVLLGWRVLTGKVKSGEEMLDSIIALVVVVVVSSFALDSALFTGWFFSPFIKTVGAFSSFAVDSSGADSVGTADVFRRIDGCMSTIIQAITAKTPPSFFTDPGIYIQLLISEFLMLSIIFMFAAAFSIIYVMSFGGICLLMALGPIPFYLAAFRATRGLFWGWVRSVFTLGLTIVFASLIVSMMVGSVEAAITDWASTTVENDGVWNQEILRALLWCVMGVALILKSADFAASVTGGQAGSTAGIAGMLSGAVGAGAGALSLRNISKLSSGGAQVLDGGRRMYSKLRGFIQ